VSLCPTCCCLYVGDLGDVALPAHPPVIGSGSHSNPNQSLVASNPPDDPDTPKMVNQKVARLQKPLNQFVTVSRYGIMRSIKNDSRVEKEPRCVDPKVSPDPTLSIV